MKLTRESVQRVAILARLRLTADEESEFTGQLDHILAYMDKLNELDTANVELFNHDIDNSSALRDDKVTNQPNTDALLANAPDRDETFFKVPKIIE
ncbi:MAG: Asp-tRNA(Asn)/Glu-tRNA(Gln) amidotransferase subunit GatC [Candidatus Binatia bacterium]|jgi:aspartyl-tRNA(Asn)/glutamyl-tRNA(Gln) amidotransferase subunit C|nr:Asp-tRNA(Asn)/Glu-tRNA(Gln) amidotransferase subunit GatC [Candidatus Deferrimicrobium sp.]